jgi:molybdopterin molybdotransferase
MISVAKALEIILNYTQDFGVEEISFSDSLGRVLKEDIKADRDFPPFNRSSMDGIGITVDAYNSGIREFNIEGIQPAGSEQLILKNLENCIETMTGAVTPKNVDAVIPYELVEIKNGIAKVSNKEIKYFQNIHKKGLDRKKNNVLIKKNTTISSAEIGVLATVGKDRVKVAKMPKVMIISTGDELVEVNKTPAYFQIRRSNVHTLVSLLNRLKIKAEILHIADDKDILKTKIDEILGSFDILLFSGAVSKGKFDFLPEVLEELGVQKLFHKVRQRPGKPFWFGVLDRLILNDSNGEIALKKDQKTTIFAFPGNPVSTYVNCLKYFYPWYNKSAGIEYENKNYAVLSKDFSFKPDLTYFLQVKLENKRGTLFATPVVGHGSGDLANLVDSDAFIELPRGKDLFKKGDVFPLLIYRNFSF